MKKVRWGIVGPGNIANKLARAIENVDCAETNGFYKKTDWRNL